MAAAAKEDPLKEPMNARSRLRRVRQEEAAKLYEQSYQRRVEGNISSVRHHPQQHLTVLSGDAAAATTASMDLSAPKNRPASSSFSDTVANAPHPAMAGRAVNVTGQSLDGPVTAIGRLLHGDFYCIRGPALDEISQKKEGKHMRFRCNSQGHMDVPLPTHEAGTMTRQSKTQTLLAHKNGRYSPNERGAGGRLGSPRHRQQQSAATGTNNKKDRLFLGGERHHHSTSPKRHHCHHGHRGTHDTRRTYDGEDEDDLATWNQYGVYDSQSLPHQQQQQQQRAARRHTSPKKSHQVRSESSDSDDPRYMAPLNLDKVFELKQAKAKKPVPTYRGPTSSFHQKMKSHEESALRDHHRQDDYNAAAGSSSRLRSGAKKGHTDEDVHGLLQGSVTRPVSGGMRPATARPATAKHRDAYETALQHQNAHAPGQAAIVSQDELRHIMTLVSKPTAFQAEGNSKHRQTAGWAGARPRRDTKELIG